MILKENLELVSTKILLHIYSYTKQHFSFSTFFSPQFFRVSSLAGQMDDKQH